MADTYPISKRICVDMRDANQAIIRMMSDSNCQELITVSDGINVFGRDMNEYYMECWATHILPDWL